MTCFLHRVLLAGLHLASSSSCVLLKRNWSSLHCVLLCHTTLHFYVLFLHWPLICSFSADHWARLFDRKPALQLNSYYCKVLLFLEKCAIRMRWLFFCVIIITPSYPHLCTCLYHSFILIVMYISPVSAGSSPLYIINNIFFGCTSGLSGCLRWIPPELSF